MLHRTELHCAALVTNTVTVTNVAQISAAQTSADVNGHVAYVMHSSNMLFIDFLHVSLNSIIKSKQM